MIETIQEKNYHYFMEADISNYAGEWIAIAENRIIAHGNNVKEVAAQAQRISNGNRFLLAKIPGEETMIF